MVRRIEGDAARGELGFRFGEPRDTDGDGRPDIAAGARFAAREEVQVGAATVWSGATGARIRAWEGEHRNGLFGHWVLLVPDIGGDGLADVVIAAPHAVVEGGGRGLVTARSVKTGGELWRSVGSAEESYGWDLAPAGDHDGDGHPDLFVGAPAGDAGRVYLLSGKDGKRLRAYAPAQDVPTFGWYVARLDDVDADGVPDLAAGAFLEKDASGASVGGAYVFSAKSGHLLHHWQGSDAWSSFGDIVAGVADVDGDGRGDVAVSAPRTFDQARDRAGEVRIYSSATGKLVRTWTGSQPGELYGRMVASVGDLDGDGVGDIAVGVPWYRHEGRERAGRVELRSGRSGAVIEEFFGDVEGGWFGWHIRPAADPEARGRPALLIGSLRHPAGGRPQAGVLEWYVSRRGGRG